MCEPFCVEPGWVEAQLVRQVAGPTYRLLRYSDHTWRFEHRCDRGDRGVIICAPSLAHHEIEQSFLGPVTVFPSILCPDCGLHGFVRANRWASTGDDEVELGGTNDPDNLQTLCKSCNSAKGARV